jgi:hypothetical protein
MPMNESFRCAAAVRALTSVMIRRLVSIAVLVSFCLGPSAAAPRPRVEPIAGYISAVSGPASDCLIGRGRETFRARFWADLRVGDRVIAKGSCEIEIMPGDGPRRWLVMESNSPTEMIEPARRQTALPAGLGPLSLALDEWNEALQPPPPAPVPKPRHGRHRRPARVPEPTAARPAPPPRLAIPLLSIPPMQRFVQGPRRFNLAWAGGRPPFTVTLSGPDGTPPVVFTIGAERVVSSLIGPGTGLCDVLISDAAGATAAGRFLVVDTPPALDRHDLATLPPEIASVVAAARLANMAGGAWRLEAHARLADLGRVDYAAALMSDRLRDGMDVPDPPMLDKPRPAIAASSAMGAAGR